MDWVEDVGQLVLANLKLLLVINDVEDAGVGEFKTFLLHHIVLDRLEGVQLSKNLLMLPRPLVFQLDFLLLSRSLVVCNMTDSEHSWRE